MFSIIVSIIAIALTTAFLAATIYYIDKPYKSANGTQLAMMIGQQYIDFGAILSSADSLEFKINSIQDLKSFNKGAPTLNYIDYAYDVSPTGERFLYNTINNEDCLDYEKFVQKNKDLTLTDITVSADLQTYVVGNERNYSCYIDSSTGNSYIVFIYSHYLG